MFALRFYAAVILSKLLTENNWCNTILQPILLEIWKGVL